MRSINVVRLFLITVMYFGICSDTFGSNDSIRYSKQNFVQAKQELQSMLTGKHPLSYERAIFVIENAFHDNILSYDGFQKVITKCVNSILDIKRCSNQEFIPVRDRNVFEMARKSDEQMKSDFYKTLTNWAIYSYITDTTLYVWNDSLFFIHLPYYYSTKDPMGTGDWTNTQVTNLLYTKQGNCFALASLFKILANRLQSDASLSTAPSHIYITHSDINGIDYNVELASRSFPGSGTLETLTYTTGDATRNGIALRTLTDEQAVALCLVYLAKGYEYKYGIKDDFMMECAAVALEYDSLNLNAMLLKAELLEDKLIRRNKTIIQLQHDVVFKKYEQLLGKLYTLGYREMPVDMKNILVNGWTKDTVELYLNNYLVQNKDETRKASLSWGLFDEEHTYKPIEQYGQTLFDCQTQKIITFTKEKLLYNEYNFDPVIFAWNVDPLAAKYPGISPYAGIANNPILFVDLDGREPVKKLITNINSVIQAMKDNNIRDINDAIKFFDYNPNKPEQRRQLYTERKGWIDLKHFFASANLVQSGQTATEVLWLGEAKEVLQYATGNPSGFGYEDLQSNLQGAVFGMNFSGLKDDDFYAAFESYFKDILKVSTFDDAPNKNYIVDDQNELEQKQANGNRIKHYSYKPLFRKREYKDEKVSKYGELLKKYKLNENKKVEEVK